MLFDTVTALHSLISANKDIEKEARMYVLICIGTPLLLVS